MSYDDASERRLTRIEGLARAVRGAPAAWLSTDLQNRIFRCASKLWFTEASWRAQEAVARELAAEANAFWEGRLGAMREWEGFQVEFQGRLEYPTFIATLFGGRSVVGTAEHVRDQCQRYVLSKRSKTAKALRVAPEQQEQR